MKNITKLKEQIIKEKKKQKILNIIIGIEILITIMIICNIKNITTNIIIGLIALTIFAILSGIEKNIQIKIENIENDIKNIDTITKAIEDSK